MVRREAQTHFTDEETKIQVSSCLSQDAADLENNGAGVSPLAFLASHSTLLPPRKDRSWNVWKVSSPLSSHLFFHHSCGDQCRCVCSCTGGMYLGRKGEMETEETMPALPGCMKNAAFSFPGIQPVSHSIDP